MLGFNININDLKNYLKLNNVTSSLTDEELTLLYKYKINELEMELGVNIAPKNHTDFISKLEFNDKILLDYYPVLEVNEVIIDGENVNNGDYILDSEDGILYFKTRRHGNIRINYTAGFNQTEYDSYIKTLIYDMIIYNQDTDSLNNVTSMTEGDTTLQYDNSSILSARINNKINNLRNSINVRATML